MTAIAEPRAASLYYRNGSSDKEYHVRLEARDAGFVVNYAYGRRGSALSTGTKTNTPVDYAAASRIFDKLVNDKQAKGIPRAWMARPTNTPTRQVKSPASCHSCSTLPMKPMLHDSSTIPPGACSRNSTGAV